MTDSMRCVVTGSRTWPDEQPIHAALDTVAYAARDNGFPGLIVVHGAAKGADAMADAWCRDRARHGWPVTVERHPADWATHRRRAGIVRNERMLRLGCDIVLAFIAACNDSKCERPAPHESHGAKHCADLAEGSGIHVVRAFTHDLAAPVGSLFPSPTESKR